MHESDHQKICSASTTTRKSTQQRWLSFLTYLEHNPIIEIKTTAKQLEMSFPTASKLIMKFVELGILQEITGRHRSRSFAYESYLSILRKDGEPL
ncbi:filamentation induced by cAMP protein Fic [gut metagenome]|uniref:Filamentation induced by cAMP protein Fic n=1 Tax=gut metagenome TaxID=749906 RepID=J9FKC7_9ZZZZ